MAIILLTSCLH